MSQEFTFQVLSKKLAFEVVPLESGGHRISLRALAQEAGQPDAVKEFFLADTSLSTLRLVSHMESLTDAQCAEFFKVEGGARPKKEKEKTAVPAEVGVPWPAGSFTEVSVPWAPGVLNEQLGVVKLFEKDGVSYLATPCGEDDLKEPRLFTEVSSKQLQKLCEGQWPLPAAVRQGKRWLLANNGAEGELMLVPVPRVQRDWLSRWGA